MDHLLVESEKREAEAPPRTQLETIAAFGKSFVIKSAELKELEARVKAKKAECTKLSQELIPQSMLDVNMTSFSLEDGSVIAFKEEVSCSVKDADKLYDFLDERGDGSLMKITLEVGKVPKNILAMMVKTIHDKFGVLPDAKLTIHPSTLRAYIKNICGIGGKTESSFSLAQLDDDMIKTYTYYKTTVK